MDMNEETFIQTLQAFQADLDVDAAVTLMHELETSRLRPTRPLQTPDRIATALMAGMRTQAGRPIRWPIVRPGQKYAPIIRATRHILEQIFKKRVILDGIPRGNEVNIEIIRIAADITREDANSQVISPTQSTSSQLTQTQKSSQGHTPRKSERSPWTSTRSKWSTSAHWKVTRAFAFDVLRLACLF